VIEGGYCDDSAKESCLLWQHLRFANIISGDPNDTNPASMVPKHAWGGAIHIFSGTDTVNATTRSGQWIALLNLPGDAAAALDRLMDDGNCNSGSMVAYNGTCNGNAYQSNVYYDVWMRF
jgi:hypothetical protein